MEILKKLIIDKLVGTRLLRLHDNSHGFINSDKFLMNQTIEISGQSFLVDKPIFSITHAKNHVTLYLKKHSKLILSQKPNGLIFNNKSNLQLLHPKIVFKTVEEANHTLKFIFKEILKQPFNPIKLKNDSSEKSKIKSLKKWNEISEIENEKDYEKRVTTLYRKHQVRFKQNLISRFNSKCVVTELSIKSIIEAAHIKQFVKCSSTEAYDVNNGILLSSNMHKLFDNFLISFDNSGKLIFSKLLTAEEIESLNIPTPAMIPNYSNEMDKYMNYHRELFKLCC
jgi:hypothetical protein